LPSRALMICSEFPLAGLKLSMIIDNLIMKRHDDFVTDA
jgi:hypothetical protein